MGESRSGQALQDETNSITVLGLGQNTVGIVDMALAVMDGTHQGLGEFIGS